MKSRHPEIRALLRAHSDGLTAKNISELTGIAPDSVRQALSNMPDVYIDRWEGPYRGAYASVWCVVEVPPHCPHPQLESYA